MLKKLWQGDFPLWFNFWILGVLIFGSSRFLFYYLTHDLKSFTAQFGIDAISLIYGFIIWLAIWRSADKYTGSPFLATAAKLVVILSALGTFMSK